METYRCLEHFIKDIGEIDFLQTPTELEGNQAEDQYGFRPKRSAIYVLLVVGEMISKCM